MIPRNSTTRPRGWRNEDGSRSKRKNRIIGRTPGSPGRSPSLQLVRPASVFCASISRGFHSHGLAGGSRTGRPCAWPRGKGRAPGSLERLLVVGDGGGEDERSFASFTGGVNRYNSHVVYIDVLNEVCVMPARGAQSC